MGSFTWKHKGEVSGKVVLTEGWSLVRDSYTQTDALRERFEKTWSYERDNLW